MSGIWNIRTFLKPRQVRSFRYTARYADAPGEKKRINLREKDFYSAHSKISRQLQGQVSHTQHRRRTMPMIGWILVLIVGLGWAWTEGWLSTGLLALIGGLLIIWLWLRKKQRPDTR